MLNFLHLFDYYLESFEAYLSPSLFLADFNGFLLGSSHEGISTGIIIGPIPGFGLNNVLNPKVLHFYALLLVWFGYADSIPQLQEFVNGVLRDFPNNF